MPNPRFRAALLILPVLIAFTYAIIAVTVEMASLIQIVPLELRIC